MGDVPFRATGTLGEGAFGKVIRAVDLRNGSEVAVKILKARWDPNAQERFRREVEETKRLRSDRVIKVLEDRLDHEHPFYVMPYMKNGSLRGHLQRLQKQGLVHMPNAALTSVGKVLEGLQVAHTKNVFHRDLKPENLLFDDSWHLVLSDFGLGDFMNRHSVVLTLGGGLGTPAYCAPEQWATGDGSAAADMYSVGVMMFEMLIGARPRLRVGNRLELPSWLDARTPAEIDGLFEQMTHPAPEARFQSCTEALARLDEVYLALFKHARPTNLVDWEKLKGNVSEFFQGIADSIFGSRNDPSVPIIR